jgi:copper(I)-binding protein
VQPFLSVIGVICAICGLLFLWFTLLFGVQVANHAMRTRLFLLSLLWVCGAAFADNAPIQVENAWLQAVPPVAEATAAYMRIRNRGPSPLRLIGAFSAIATNIEPMITTRRQRNGQEVLGMESVESLEIPPGGVLELKPGGSHLMLMGLTSHPREGEHVKVTVRFAPGDQRLDVEIPVFKQEPK